MGRKGDNNEREKGMNDEETKDIFPGRISNGRMHWDVILHEVTSEVSRTEYFSQGTSHLL